MRQNVNRYGRFGSKALLGVALCAIVAGVAYFGFTVGAKAIKQDAVASVPPAAATRRHRPVQSMNIALGDMVYFSQDLGFTVKSAKNDNQVKPKIALKIENHLQNLREVYRLESAKNPSLVGVIRVECNTGPAGEVTQVKEVSSSVADASFRKSVLAAVSNWSFADVVAEPMSISFPLLFVREGMDITTLVQWEAALGRVNEKGNQSSAVTGAVVHQQSTNPRELARVESAKPVDKPIPASPIASADKADSKIYRIKYPTALRKNPNFSAQSLGTFTAGTRLSILSKRGDWLEVKSADNDLSGYIRKEFAAPVDVARK